jgi:hypothetical protein
MPRAEPDDWQNRSILFPAVHTRALTRRALPARNRQVGSEAEPVQVRPRLIPQLLARLNGSMNECEVRAKLHGPTKIDGRTIARTPRSSENRKSYSWRGTHARNATALLGVCRKKMKRFGSISPRECVSATRIVWFGVSETGVKKD